MARTAFPVRLRLVLLLTIPALGACGSDSNGGTEPVFLTVQQLASDLNVAAGGDPLTDNTEKSISDLSADIARVMASKGISSPPPVGQRFPGADVAGLLATAPRAPIVASAMGDAAYTVLGGLSASAIGPLVLGVTCVWKPEQDFWGGSPDIYGPVPDDGTRFEMYMTQPGAPLLPLQKLNTFADVRPLVQASDPDNPGNVNLIVTARSTGASLVNLLLAGQSNPATNTLDLLMNGDVRSGGGSVMSYLFSIDNSRAVNIMEVGDILIIASVSASGGARGNLLIQKRDDPRQAVEYDFALSSTGGAITAGDVFVGSNRVAGVAGDRRAPVFTIQANNFDEVDNLELIYENVLKLDGGINELFFFAHCVGSDEPAPCQLMVQQLLGGN